MIKNQKLHLKFLNIMLIYLKSILRRYFQFNYKFLDGCLVIYITHEFMNLIIFLAKSMNMINLIVFIYS